VHRDELDRISVTLIIQIQRDIESFGVTKPRKEAAEADVPVEIGDIRGKVEQGGKRALLLLANVRRGDRHFHVKASGANDPHEKFTRALGRVATKIMNLSTESSESLNRLR
jgi:hypothetical protein